MPETSSAGRLTHAALALGARLDMMGRYSRFFTTSWPHITSPWVYLGTDWCWREDDMQTGMFLWVMLIAEMVLGWLFWGELSWLVFIELNYQEQPVMWKKKEWEKGSRCWEDACTREVEHYSCYLFEVPSFSSFWRWSLFQMGSDIWKKKSWYVCREQERRKSLRMCVNVAWKFITKRCMEMSSVEFGSQALQGIAKYSGASPHRLV